MKIAHISDIHWRGIQRHQEYNIVFNTLYGQLRKIQPDYIVLTGDIFHTKTQGITPEVVKHLAMMFKTFGDITKTIVILGNHDGNLSNFTREDIISPIINALNHKNIFLYKKSGNNVHSHSSFGDINFSVFSCFDQANWDKCFPLANAYNIALFHGAVTGCILDTEIVYDKGDITLEDFEKFNCALLGDIHKQQFLAFNEKTNQPWIGYPGSLIQQNHGESLDKGWLLWNYDDNTKEIISTDFIKINNDYSFHTVDWFNSVNETVDKISLKFGSEEHIKNKRIRIAFDDKLSSFERKLLKEKLTQLKADDIVFNNVGKLNIEAIKAAAGSLSRTDLRNDPESLYKLFKEYQKHSQLSIDEKNLDQLKKLIEAYMTKLNNLEQDSEESNVRNVNWTINKLTFDNLYRYGSGNTINFSKLNGIVGVFGPNRTGKSSLIGSLTYGLFNTTDRGPLKSSYIINKNKTKASCTVEFEVDKQKFLIKREAEKALQKRKNIVDEEKAATTLNFFKVSEDGTAIELKSENAEKRTDTDKQVRKIIGTAQDFALTSLATQGGIAKFIDEGATQRKAILNKFFDIDIFDKFYKLVNEDYTALQNSLKGQNSVDIEVELTNQEIKNKNAKKNQEELTLKIEELNNELIQLAGWLSANENTILSLDKSEQLEKELKKLLTDKDRIENQLKNYKTEKESLEIFLTSNNDSLLENEIISLEKLMEEIISLENSKKEQENKFSLKNNELSVIKKNVKKLSVVPCGDSFPTCHFIKDAHEDKGREQEQALLVEELQVKIKEITESLSLLSSSSFLKREIAAKKDIIVKIANVNKRLETIKREEKLLSDLLENITGTYNEKITNQKVINENLGNRNEILNKKARVVILKQEIQNLNNNLRNNISIEATSLATIEKLQEEKEKHKKVLYKIKTLEILQQAFSKNGIPALILKNILPSINEEIQRLLSGVVDFTVVVETEIDSNTLDLFIVDQHSKRVLELASGMEKMLASLALRAALITLTPLPKSDILIIDEGFGVLDDESLQKCLNLLQALRSRFRIIMLISHITQVKEIADTIIEIEVNNENESKIQVN